MNENEKKTGIDDGLNVYKAANFVTTDANQLAFDNYESLVFSPSGLAGAMPMMQTPSFDPPRGFRYELTTNGLGGNASPVSANAATPLINQDPQFAEAFIRNTVGGGGSLY